MVIQAINDQGCSCSKEGMESKALTNRNATVGHLQGIISTLIACSITCNRK